VLEGREWDWRKFDFDRDIETVDKAFARDFNATDTDLSKFKNHGGHRGKLILYSGWADPLIPPQTTINYYNAVIQTMFGDLSPKNVEDAQGFARLFHGTGHVALRHVQQIRQTRLAERRPRSQRVWRYAPGADKF